MTLPTRSSANRQKVTQIAAAPTLSISSGTVTLDCAAGNYARLSPGANVTAWTINNAPPSGVGQTILILFTQDSSPRTVAWPSSFKWPGGSAPSVSTGSGAKDLLAITTFDGGTTWMAALAKGHS